MKLLKPGTALVLSAFFLACGSTRSAAQKGQPETVAKFDTTPKPDTNASQAGITQAEIQWALALEKRVKTEGYQPNAEETAQYEDLSRKLAAEYSRRSPSGDANPPETREQNYTGTAHVTTQELQWATGLESQVNQGYQATQQEMDRYQDIFERYQQDHADQARQAPSPQPYPASPPSPGAPAAPGTFVVDGGSNDPELKWALGLLNRVQNEGYQPTPEEMERYGRAIERNSVPDTGR